MEQRKRLPVSVSVAVFIENEEGKLLMVQQAGEDEDTGKWGFPAGGMDAHEDPMMAAIREAKEETGFDVKLTDLVRIYVFDHGDDASGIAFSFRCRIVGGEMTLPPDEISDCRYFSVAEIQDLLAQGKIYKPEYNTVNLQNRLEGRSYPFEVIRPLLCRGAGLKK